MVQTATEEINLAKAEAPAIADISTLSAPFPPTADSGISVYDPIAATSGIPPFEDLLTNWVAAHSVKRVDSQTVVMSSVHYTDFLAMRNQLMAINDLLSRGDVIFNRINRQVSVINEGSVTEVKAQSMESMTEAAQRLLGHIECEAIF
jgi:hypothetical protein